MVEKNLVQASSMRKGSYILIEGHACIVKDVQTSQPGKHGHKKVRIAAEDMILKKRREIVQPAHDKVEVPIIHKRIGQILSIEGGNVSLMDNESFETLDADLELADDEIKKDLETGQTVAYWNVVGKLMIKQIK